MSDPVDAPESAPVEVAPEEQSPEEKHLTPLQAIRAKCIDCSGDNETEVRLCHVEHCPQWPFRFGKNPFRKKMTLTDQQKLERIARINNVRECRAMRLSMIDKHKAGIKQFIIHNN